MVLPMGGVGEMGVPSLNLTLGKSMNNMGGSTTNNGQNLADLNASYDLDQDVEQDQVQDQVQDDHNRVVSLPREPSQTLPKVPISSVQIPQIPSPLSMTKDVLEHMKEASDEVSEEVLRAYESIKRGEVDINQGETPTELRDIGQTTSSPSMLLGESLGTGTIQKQIATANEVPARSPGDSPPGDSAGVSPGVSESSGSNSGQDIQAVRKPSLSAASAGDRGQNNSVGEKESVSGSGDGSVSLSVSQSQSVGQSVGGEVGAPRSGGKNAGKNRRKRRR